MHTPRILIVAPTSDLQQSLRFALEAERYGVTWRASIGAVVMPDQFDCTVLDHHAIGDNLDVARGFVGAFEPVVLLANKSHDLSPFVFRTILKPRLGVAVIEAVQDALAAQRISR